MFTKIPLIKSDKLDCRERAIAAKTIPPAASILVSSKLKTRIKLKMQVSQIIKTEKEMLLSQVLLFLIYHLVIILRIYKTSL